MKDSSSEDKPQAETLIPYDQIHHTYILGPLYTEPPLFPYITESLVLHFSMPKRASQLAKAK